ncbi:hypothetical protein K503DRAFT_856203 [Rhizopogon vinicolor AM-OR11-026]|uniref:Uncharacterized protein n=1 Tax=Rhizopogon vinicolor AM-OR11-026 TaxID=1314800 RepID=A0A1B7N2Y1_9AGAM|nr:hypothetical protein K503DRAFT_856203 [Rhizopogon vinicolor AM-OR11-026]
MHRFRKKSDASRHNPSDDDRFTPPTSELKHLPELPLATDFRTSLILPELTRRFTLLQSPSGDPLTLEDIRSRFAEQRSRGVPIQITEEEEDMVLGTLGRIRVKNAASSTTPSRKVDDGSVSADAPDLGMESDYTHERTSHISTATASTTYPASSITSSPSPSSRSTKRYSNNLFASGRFREYSYLRTVSQRSGSSRGAASITPSDSDHSLREKPSSNFSENLRPVTPEDGHLVSSVPSSPNEKTPLARSASLISSTEDFSPQPLGDHIKGSSHPSSSNSSSVQRAEAALESVIREFEEEAEDEILMPRTAHPAPRSGEQSNAASPTSDSESGTSIRNPQSPIDYEAGTAILSDKQMNVDPEMQHISPTPYGRAGTVSPTPRLPGYIPGMPRPMTPRDPSFDSDDARAHSATPRAMSPTLPNANGASLITTTFTSGLLRRGSDASRSTPRPISPSVAPPASSFLSRSAGGQYSSDSQRESASSTDQEASVTSIFRRRPASPLTGSAFRPMLVSSRPGTPSNITWNVNSPSSTPSSTNRTHSRRGSASSHSRSGSLSTDSDFQPNGDKSKSPNRPIRLPAPPETSGFTQVANIGAWNHSTGPAPVDHRSPSSLSGVLDFGSSLSTRTMRSPTPTQSRSAAASPAFSSNDSPDFSNHVSVRSPKHHSKSSSHFSLGLSQPAAFSALANSSRSSLESTGSSYHSWSAGHKKDITLELFSSVEQQPKWHDLDKLSPATPGSLQDDDSDDFEDIIRRYTGLTKSDFVVIQDKLVSAVRAKESNTEPRERANSLRRRRPSTSQSNYSVNGRDNRVASPPPNQPAPAQVSTTGRRSPAPDQAAKAHALLDSVVGSIPRTPAVSVVTDIKVQVEDPPEVKASPTTTRRNRDLARALGFGDEQAAVALPQDTSPPIENISQSNKPSQIQVPSVTTPEPVEPVTPPTQGGVQPSSNASSYTLPSRSASMRSPRPLMDQAELVNEVRRKAEAATAALMKTSSGQKFTDANASSISVTRKKINLSQISAPHLVSGPTSVETIPLHQVQRQKSPTPIAPQSSLNITQRMRRFRNTLRVKQHVPSGEEVTPFPLDVQPNAVSSASLNRRPTLPLTKGFAYGSSTDLTKSKSLSSPPASATPGLRGFMSRFRKPRAPDTQTENGNGFLRGSPTTSSPTTSSHHGQGLGASPTNAVTPASAPVSTTTFMHTLGGGQPSIDSPSAMADNETAVKQLLEAGANLGVNQAELKALLARSASVSSRAMAHSLSKNTSNAVAGSYVARDVPSAARSRSPLPAESHLHDDGAISGGDERTVRKLSIHKTGESSHNRQGIPENPAIVRRTLIFPSDFRTSTPDPNQVTRKPSGKRHGRSGSSMSVHSGRSVHDRAPTPPPPKSTGGKRFSTDRPPLPSLPTSMAAQAEALLHPVMSGATGEKTGSPYESLYDMYTGESKHANTPAEDAVDIGSSHEAEGYPEGAALEVVEMANGETIWSIVNGLRDDDLESAYASRTSLTSEYSLRENPEGLQVFVKEHGRSASKSSNSSFLSRKKPSQNRTRPDTKVFYSSSAHIGRLIESLSQGMDAGSFNFGNLPPDRSTPSSFHSDADVQWTIEEKLEHMLGSMRNP